MTPAPPQALTETVRVHETPYVLRVEIDLPDGEPQMLFAITNRGLEIRIFHPSDALAAVSEDAAATSIHEQ